MLRVPPPQPGVILDAVSQGLRVHVGHRRKPPKRRVWRKLPLAVNADTGEVLASDLTSRRTADCTLVTVLIPPGRGVQPSSSRSPGQRIKANLACKILNTMTGLGMPESVRVR